MQMENCKSLNELCFCTAYIYTKSGNWFFVVFKALRLIFVKLDIFYSERLELWRRAFQCFAHKQTESSNKFYYNVGMAEKYVHTLPQITNKIIFSYNSIKYSLLSFNKNEIYILDTKITSFMSSVKMAAVKSQDSFHGILLRCFLFTEDKH